MIEQRESARGDLEVGSPHWVIYSIEKRAARLYDALTEKLGFGRAFDFFLAAISLAAVVVMVVFNEERVGYIEGDRYLSGFFWFVRLFFAVAFASSTLRFFGLRAGRRFDVLMIVFTMAADWSTYAVNGNQKNYWPQFAYYFVVIAYLYVMDFWARRTRSRQPTMLVFTFGYLVLLAGWWSFGHFGPANLQFTKAKYSFFPERLFFPLLVFWWEGTSLIAPRKLFSRDRLFQVLSPVSQIFPLPLKSDQYLQAAQAKLNRIRLLGLVDIVVASAAVVIYYVIDHALFLEVTSGVIAGLTFLWIGFLFYLLMYLKSFWLFRMITAIGRTLGLDLKDGFNYALLAVNPADRWRRWSIYYNEWLRDFFFFPILAKSRNVFLALFITFMVSFFQHTFGLFSYIGFSRLETSRELQVRSNLVYYILQFLVVYLTSLTIRYWPEGRKRSGWYGVLATIFIMSVVHVLVWIAR